MKPTKRIVALLLCLLMTCALCACSDAATLKGEWRANADMTEALSKELKTELYDISDYLNLENLFVSVSLSLNRDNTYKLSLEISDTSLEKLNTAVRAGAEAYVEDYYIAAAALLGLDLEGLRAMYEAQRMDMDKEMSDDAEEVVKESAVAETLAEILSAYASEGTWSAQEGKLLLNSADGSEYSFEYADLSSAGFSLVAGNIGFWTYPLKFDGK